MEWGKEQEIAIERVCEWLDSGRDSSQVFKLFGYAGTGKTTLAKYIAQFVNGTVLFAAFTGKAAHVMKSKGCDEATTIHSLIYKPQEKGTKTLEDITKQLEALISELTPEKVDIHPRVKELREMKKVEEKNLSRPSFKLNPDSIVKHSALIIIDECSMVDSEMAEDLLSFGTKVLVLGDPAQLPPVKGANGGYFTSGTPDVMLTEVHRQAEHNPILKMATLVRNNKPLPLGLYGDSRVISAPDREEILRCDQVIVGLNKTRFSYNKRIRTLKNFTSPLPQEGDKLVCLRNNHDLGLLNGAIYYVKEVDYNPELDEHRILLKILPEIAHEDTQPTEVLSHIHHFVGIDLPYGLKQTAQEFDYGYALTCHKSQGSQWNHVVVVDESDSFRGTKSNWLYTAITRAAEKVTVIRA